MQFKRIINNTKFPISFYSFKAKLSGRSKREMRLLPITTILSQSIELALYTWFYCFACFHFFKFTIGIMIEISYQALLVLNFFSFFTPFVLPTFLLYNSSASNSLKPPLAYVSARHFNSNWDSVTYFDLGNFIAKFSPW